MGCPSLVYISQRDSMELQGSILGFCVVFVFPVFSLTVQQQQQKHQQRKEREKERERSHRSADFKQIKLLFVVKTQNLLKKERRPVYCLNRPTSLCENGRSRQYLMLSYLSAEDFWRFD
jgi:hypothetical protein